MSYLRLLLGVTREAPQTGRDNPAIPFEDTGFGLLRAKVFERDRYVCQFCGFTSNKYQDILPRPPSRQDNGAARGANRIDSLATACIFCHQCAKLEIVPKMQSGVLIWLPEISQAALHHVMRAIYVARRTQGPMADAARGALDALLERRVDCKRRIGTDDPVVLSAIMQDLLEEKYYRKRGEKLDGVRLLNLTSFPKFWPIGVQKMVHLVG